MTPSILDSLQQQIADIEAKISETKLLAANDPSMAELANEEIDGLTQQKKALQSSLSQINGDFEPKVDESSDPDSMYDNSPAIVEIRGGAGGEEDKIFADDLIRMYMKFAETHKFKVEWVDEGVMKIRGKNAYGTFKYEAGVHRV